MRIIGPQKRGLFTALIGVHQNPIGMIVRRNIRKSWQIFIGRLCAAILADLYWMCAAILADLLFKRSGQQPFFFLCFMLCVTITGAVDANLSLDTHL
jgi:hypothetical protein